MVEYTKSVLVFMKDIFAHPKELQGIFMKLEPELTWITPFEQKGRVYIKPCAFLNYGYVVKLKNCSYHEMEFLFSQIEIFSEENLDHLETY